MKHPYALTLLMAACALNGMAQNDSTNRFNVYKSLLQETTTPALIGDNGKHIVHVNTRILVNSYMNQALYLDYANARYCTQWRKHGFGIYGNAFSNDFYSMNTAGIQYAYGFEFNKKHKLLANTKIVAAAGIAIAKETEAYPGYIFGDQIQGTVAPSPAWSEESVVYPTLDLGLLVRSSRMFANLALLNVNKPDNRMNEYDAPRNEIQVMLNSGVKFIEYRKFSTWILLDYAEKTISNLGLAASYQNRYTLSAKMNENSDLQFRFGYFTPRIRAFVQYGDFDNIRPKSFDSGILAIGIAAGITKQ